MRSVLIAVVFVVGACTGSGTDVTGSRSESLAAPVVPSIAVQDTTLVERDTGTANAVFAVTLSNASDVPVTVDYATDDRSATAGADYGPASGMISFAPGQVAATISVQVFGDVVDEADEAFVVDLTGPVNATLARARGKATITNDDLAPALSISDVSVREGAAGTTSAVFVVSLDSASDQGVQVSYATSDGSADAGSDYGSASGVLTFAPGEVSRTVAISVFGDALPEADETLHVTLSGPVNATIARVRGTGTIRDDDFAPAVTIADVDVVESDSGSVSAVFTVSLSNASAQPVDVSFATADRLAVAGSDYGPSSGVVSFVPGQVVASVVVQVVGDTVVEPDETFFVNLSSATGATIARARATGTIVNDDFVPAITIADISVVEPASGTATALFAVSLSSPSTQAVTVDFATGGGSATAGSDYLPLSGTVSFAPGEVGKTIGVQVLSDAIVESNETFFVDLANPSGATIAEGTGRATITRTAATPALSITDAAVAEADSGTVGLAFTITLSSSSTQVVTVDYATANGTADAGSDYGSTAGQLTFAPGDVAKTVIVQGLGDTIPEADETLFVKLSNPVRATLARAKGKGTLVDDDPAVALSIADVAGPEADSGATTATFVVTLSGPSVQAVQVHYATSDGSADAGSDYTPTAGTLLFAPGEVAKTVSVQVNGDVLPEADETFFVELSGAVNAVLARPRGRETIQDQDFAPTITIADARIVEGDAGSAAAVFTVGLSGPSTLGVAVAYATSDHTAEAGSDYGGTSGVLSFAPGEVTRTILVAVNGDAMAEADETFFVTLSAPVNATLDRVRAIGTIVSDDPAPAIAIADQLVLEPATGTAIAAFPVWLSTTTAQVVSVDYATSDGTADAGSDYVPAAGTITFAPGEVVKTIGVQVVGDVVTEDDETFFVNLTGPLGATLDRARARGTIRSD